jgi:large subunit ribosomal protein L31
VKPDIHPSYRPVVFSDTASDFQFLTKSTIETSETIEWEDGNTYPFAKVEISSASHPFYTGKQILVDTTGRVERFRKRYGQTATAPKAEDATEAPEAETADAEAETADAEAETADAEAETADAEA